MRKKVLIVDDSLFMRMVLKDIISNHLPNLDIIEADSAKSALNLLMTETPNIVFLDIIMNKSETEGLQVLEKIHHQYPNIAVIMVTSVGHESIQQKCALLGVKAYILKPFDPEVIYAEINKLL